MAEDYMLTTIDNPYNPFTNFDEWYAYDVQHGYDTCGYIARIANVSYALPDLDNEEEIDRAITDIIIHNSYGFYKIITKE